MKKRLLFAFAILAVMSLAIAAFAYGGMSVSSVDDKMSCCKKDSCPMKGEDHKSGDHAKMKGHDCCGDSCPMKKKDGAATATAVSASDEGKSCCDDCDCCKANAMTDTAAV